MGTFRKKARAAYSYQVIEKDNRKIVLIEDQDSGGMSVTNDIENVVADIAFLEEIEPEKCLIIYQDSDGIWDGWDAATNSFISLQKHSWEEGLKKYLERFK